MQRKSSHQRRKRWSKLQGTFVAIFIFGFYLVARREQSDLPRSISIWLDSNSMETIVLIALSVSMIMIFIAFLNIYWLSDSKDEYLNYSGGGTFFNQFSWPIFLALIGTIFALEIWIRVG